MEPPPHRPRAGVSGRARGGSSHGSHPLCRLQSRLSRGACVWRNWGSAGGRAAAGPPCGSRRRCARSCLKPDGHSDGGCGETFSGARRRCRRLALPRPGRRRRLRRPSVRRWQRQRAAGADAAFQPWALLRHGRKGPRPCAHGSCEGVRLGTRATGLPRPDPPRTPRPTASPTAAVALAGGWRPHLRANGILLALGGQGPGPSLRAAITFAGFWPRLGEAVPLR